MMLAGGNYFRDVDHMPCNLCHTIWIIGQEQHKYPNTLDRKAVMHVSRCLSD